MYGLSEARYGSSAADSAEERRRNHKDAIKAQLEAQRLAAEQDADFNGLLAMRAMDNIRAGLVFPGIAPAIGGFGGGFCCMGGFC